MARLMYILQITVLMTNFITHYNRESAVFVKMLVKICRNFNDDLKIKCVFFGLYVGSKAWYRIVSFQCA